EAKPGLLGAVASPAQRELIRVVDIEAEEGTAVLIFESGVVDRHRFRELDVTEAAGGGLVVVAVPSAVAEAAGKAVVTPGDNRGAHGLLAGAAPAETGAGPEPRVVGRSLRDQVEHTPDRVGAGEHRRRAADDLGARHVLERHQAGDLAEVGLTSRVVETQAVLEEQHA